MNPEIDAVEVFVPCVDVGLGTLTVTIRDASGGIVRVEWVRAMSVVAGTAA